MSPALLSRRRSIGSAAAQSYSQLILAESGLQSYWRLGEAAGALVDQGPGAKTLAEGGTVTRAVAGALPSDSDKAIDFLGTGNASNATNGLYAFPTNAGANPFSLECWVKPNSWTDCAIASTGRTVAGSWMVSFATDGRPGFAYGAGTVNFSATDPMSTSSWTHLVITVDSSRVVRCYQNGALKVTSGAQSAMTSANQPFALGSRYDGVSFFTGKMDEAAIYNTDISLAQVQAHYNKGIA